MAVGDRYKLLRPFGSQLFDPIGARHGLRADAIGTVVAEVPAAEKGAHNDFEDALILEFEDETRAVGTDGELVKGTHTRRVSFAVNLFSADPAMREMAEQMQSHLKGDGNIAADPTYNDGPLFEVVK